MHAVGFVQFEDVLVAPVGDGAGRAVMEEIVGQAVSATVKNSQRPLPVQPADVVDVAVLDRTLAGRERLAIAAVDADPGRSDLGDLAAGRRHVGRR